MCIATRRGVIEPQDLSRNLLRKQTHAVTVNVQSVDGNVPVMARNFGVKETRRSRHFLRTIAFLRLTNFKYIALLQNLYVKISLHRSYSRTIIRTFVIQRDSTFLKSVSLTVPDIVNLFRHIDAYVYVQHLFFLFLFFKLKLS